MLRQLFEWPLAERCIGLDMGEVRRFYGDFDGLLKGWPGAPGLLRLSGFGSGALTSGHLPGLVSVDFRNVYGFSEEMASALAALPGLRCLRLSPIDLEPRGAEALAKLSGLR